MESSGEGPGHVGAVVYVCMYVCVESVVEVWVDLWCELNGKSMASLWDRVGVAIMKGNLVSGTEGGYNLPLHL